MQCQEHICILEKVIKTSDGVVNLSVGWYILIINICYVGMACTNSQGYGN